MRVVRLKGLVYGTWAPYWRGRYDVVHGENGVSRESLRLVGWELADSGRAK